MHLVAIGGSDAGISAALRARELDPTVDVTVVVADAYPNFSICGIPYYISGEVTPLAQPRPPHPRRPRSHRHAAAPGHPRHRHRRRRPAPAAARRRRRRVVAAPTTSSSSAPAPSRSAHRIDGLDDLGPRTACTCCTPWATPSPSTGPWTGSNPKTALIVGAGYVGLEMAEGLTARGIKVTQVEMLPEVLPTVDPELGALVHDELDQPRRRRPHRAPRVTRISRGPMHRRRSARRRPGTDGEPLSVGRRPGARRRRRTPRHRPPRPRRRARPAPRGAVVVDETMATGLPHVWAAGDCVVTHHRLLGVTYLPLGTTAHKQGRVAGENALGGDAPVRRQPRHPGRQGLRPRRRPHRTARTRSHSQPASPRSHHPAIPDDHKAYYPGAQPITIRVTGDTETGRLLGAQLVGARGTETAKRVDTYATALFHGMTVDGLSELDLSYTPPLGSPWDAVQMAAQDWVKDRAKA